MQPIAIFSTRIAHAYRVHHACTCASKVTNEIDYMMSADEREAVLALTERAVQYSSIDDNEVLEDIYDLIEQLGATVLECVRVE